MVARAITRTLAVAVTAACIFAAGVLLAHQTALPGGDTERFSGPTHPTEPGGKGKRTQSPEVVRG
jgi:hypothetical protein